MAYYAGTHERLTIYGPGDLVAGETDDEALAEVWTEILPRYEANVLEALDADDTATAERIWADVEARARGALLTRQAIERAGTQEALAAELGVEQGTVSRWAAGERKVPGPARKLMELVVGAGVTDG